MSWDLMDNGQNLLSIGIPQLQLDQEIIAQFLPHSF